MTTRLVPLDFCAPPQQACAAAWATELLARPELAKAAFWAGGPAVSKLLILLRSVVSDYRTFIDIGAAVYNPGDESDVGSGAMAFFKLWSRRTHPITVHAFEPSNTHLDGFSNRSRGEIQLHHTIVSDRAGRVPFYGTKNVATSNVRLLGHPRYAGASVRTVPSTTVDAVAAREGLERIDILKVDAEGTEWEVLLGSHTLLSRRRVRVLIAAYEHPWSIDTAAAVYPLDGGNQTHDHRNRRRPPPPTVREMQIPSLFSVTRHLRAYGYDAYLLGYSCGEDKAKTATGGEAQAARRGQLQRDQEQPARVQDQQGVEDRRSSAISASSCRLHLLPLSGACWDDLFEFGREPSKYSLPFTWFDFVAVVSDSVEGALLRSRSDGGSCFPGVPHLESAARAQAAADEEAKAKLAVKRARKEAKAKAARKDHAGQATVADQRSKFEKAQGKGTPDLAPNYTSTAPWPRGRATPKAKATSSEEGACNQYRTLKRRRACRLGLYEGAQKR